LENDGQILGGEGLKAAPKLCGIELVHGLIIGPEKEARRRERAKISSGKQYIEENIENTIIITYASQNVPIQCVYFHTFC
jgi:hypothetical protein